MLLQGTDAWLQIRAGKLTASRLSDALARTKSGWGASRANLVAQLAIERLTGQPVDSGFISPAMQWGIGQEPAARAAYEMRTGELVATVGFVDHPTILMAGASPDGLVGSDGLLEIKCPNSATHIEYLRGNIPLKYQLQMQWQMACTVRAWCDFMSYDPRMPDGLQISIQRVKRENIDQLEDDAIEFLAEVDRLVAELESMRA